MNDNDQVELKKFCKKDYNNLIRMMLNKNEEEKKKIGRNEEVISSKQIRLTNRFKNQFTSLILYIINNK